MSRIDDLIAALCPDGVEYRSIGELAECVAGATPSKSVAAYWIGGTIPWMSSGEVNKGTVWETDQLITQAAYDSCSTRLVPAGAVVMALAGQGKTRGTVARTRLSLCTNQSLCSMIVHDDVDSDFLFYFLRTQYQRLRELSSGDGTRGGLNLQMIRTYRVPVPPKEVQREVVQILDSFTELEAELEAELDARTRQYTHYRDALLAFDPQAVRWSPFGEVARIVRGGSPRPIQAYLTDSDAGVNWIKIGDVAAGGKFVTTTAQKIRPDGVARSRTVRPGDFILSNSMSFGRPYIVQIDGCIHDGWLAIKDYTDAFIPDFLYHLLRSTAVYREMAQRAGGGTVQNLNADIVKALILPIPPFEEQQRIVAILDRFESLVNDLSSGLPAELAARRKQYEHYRDRLLTFEEKVA